jgi:hypothetical protein
MITHPLGFSGGFPSFKRSQGGASQRNGSAVSSTSRGHKFCSQHPCLVAHSCLWLQLQELRHSRYIVFFVQRDKCLSGCPGWPSSSTTSPKQLLEKRVCLDYIVQITVHWGKKKKKKKKIGGGGMAGGRNWSRDQGGTPNIGLLSMVCLQATLMGAFSPLGSLFSDDSSLYVKWQKPNQYNIWCSLPAFLGRHTHTHTHTHTLLTHAHTMHTNKNKYF